MKYESAFNAMDGILTSSPSLISHISSLFNKPLDISSER